MSALRARIGALVHPVVGEDAQARSRHVGFMLSRLGAGLFALAVMPVYLAVWGAPGLDVALALACFALPIGAVAVLSRTGRLVPAHAMSSLALAALVVIVSRATGGAASPALLWLPLLPLEALLSGERRAAAVGAAVAGLAAATVLAMDAFGAAAREVVSPAAVLPVAAASAIAYATALVFAAQRREADGRVREVARDLRDRAVLEALDDLVTWHDASGQVVFASEASAALIGQPPASLAGRGLFERVHVADRPAFLKALADARHLGRPVALRYRLMLPPPDGRGAPRVRWVEMRAVRNASGEAADAPAVVAVIRDVTELHLRESELEEARGAAVAASRSKDHFLATVSHELRTPLNAIIGFSEMLANEALCPADEARRREYAGLIAGSGRHLLDVVNTLLDVSRLESGNFAIVPEPFDIAALMRECCDLMEVKARETGVRIVRDLAHDDELIIADRRACRQIAINLLANAVKFSPQGDVSVSLGRAGMRLVLTVSDTGIGIAESDLPRLGKPFFQAQSAYDRPHEGTGLGLSVVRGLVALHGGTLSVASCSGEGTTVTVSLPVDCRVAPAPAGPDLAIETIVRPRGTVQPFRREMKKSA